MAKNLDVMLDMLRAMKQMCADISKKNYPGSHDQLEHGSWSDSLHVEAAVNDLGARSASLASAKPKAEPRDATQAVRAKAKVKDYTKNAEDDGKACWTKCQEVIKVKSKEIKDLKAKRELLDKEIAKPEFAGRVIKANKNKTAAERQGNRARAARAEEEIQDAGNANLEMLEQQQALDQRILAAEEVLKQELQEVIFINNEGTTGPEMDSAHSLGKIVDNNMDNINAATDFVGRIVAPEYLSKLTPYTVDDPKGQRANVTTRYMDEGPVTVMRLEPDEEAKYIAHELGHVIEDQVPSIKENAIIYYKDRTSGSDIELLRDVTKNNYGVDEICKKDNFIDAYMGKFYGSDYSKITPSSTELVSMGIQMLYTDPKKLIDEDPAMFTWLVDTLRGKNKIQPRKDDDYY